MRRRAKREMPKRSEVASAVAAYNAVYSEMDEALWQVSMSVRGPLLERRLVPGIETLVWTVRSWWGVRGVKTETRRIAARALVEMEWTEKMFGKERMPDGQQFAIQRVTSLVTRMNELGVDRREFSLAAKVLHWLMPWHVAIYDSFVCRSVGIPSSAPPERAYRELVEWENEAARRLDDGSSEWLGTVNPRSPIRAVDKYLWWVGGGNLGTAARIKDPWKICRDLGLSRG